MTPADWLNCTNRPKSMIDAVAVHAPARKLRLLAIAIAELVLPPDEPLCQEVLRTARSYANGRVTESTLRQAHAQARVHVTGLQAFQYATQLHDPGSIAAASAIMATTFGNARAAVKSALTEAVEAVGHRSPEGQKQVARARFRQQACDLVREFFGPLDHPLALAPSWLLTNTTSSGPAVVFRKSITSAALRLADAANQEQDLTLLPVLADVLEDAGCEDRVLLSHLRDTSAPHRPGCWALDAILAVHRNEERISMA